MKYYIKENDNDFYKRLKLNSEGQKGNETCFTFYDFIGDNKIVTEITRKELLYKSLNIAAELKKQGAKKGDRAIIFATQTCDNVLSVVASVLSGVIFTLIPPPIDSSKMDRFLSVMNSCKPKFILCGTKLKNTIEGVLLKLKENSNYTGLLNAIKIVDVEKCEDTKEFEPEHITLEDVIYIQYTSGSTSAPKGILVRYGNLLSSLNGCLEVYSQIRRVFGWVPFFHNLGLAYLIFSAVIRDNICSGVMSPAAFLEKPSRWVEGINEFKADVTLAPNSVYETYPKLVPASFLKEKNIDLSTVKLFLNGSEMVSYEAMVNFVNEYKEFNVTIDKFGPGYGLSETACGISVAPRYDENTNLSLDFEAYKDGKLSLADEKTENTIEFVSSGTPIPGVLFKIVNPATLEECAEDEFGEVWTQSGCNAKGYYENEEATKETFEGTLKGYDGNFLRTGDLGIIRNGHIYITGRIKELIIVNGNNILPNDIVLKLKHNIPELNLATIVPFSVNRDNKEKLVIIIAGKDELIKNIHTDELIDKINSCILKYFEITPYEVGFADIKNIPASDNGKISIMAAARKYNAGELPLVGSTKDNQEEKIIVYNTKTQEALGNIIKSDFSVKATIDDNLLSLGMDSLQVVGLTNSIEKVFKVSVPVAFIFESPTIQNIAEYIDKSLAGEDLSSLEKDKSFLRDEVVLDEKITASEYETKDPEMKNIFLTGTTGFVGAYLIRSLLSTTKGKIYCHVRAKSEEAGLQRIKDNMEYYKVWKEEYAEYIVPVLGSLEKPLLGIKEDVYKFLTENIDIIYHNGAVLNFIYPYAKLKDANVLGTVKTIELACTGKQKFYNYVSSYSVFDNPSYFNKEVSEDDELKECKGYYLSYSETKWVAENIIHVARERGLKAAIYRPGEITGATDTGIWKLGDSVSRTIKAIIDTKSYPLIDMNMHMTQVDYIADAIVSISTKGESYGKAYNLLNSVKVPLRWLGEIINESGYEAKPMGYEEWKGILYKSGNEHPLKLLEALFKITKKNKEEELAFRYGEVEARHGTTNADKALEGTGITCPPIDEELIRKYLKNFV